ncbi:hypothetical protein [Streptomyces platensis]|uniref:hypothetical protein n=1 Tax=Streptomyces platensis TaxID=58346 RepID=UPI00386773A5|nr:hypothetical protein OG962_35625 [Streptomyces platensis]
MTLRRRIAMTASVVGLIGGTVAIAPTASAHSSAPAVAASWNQTTSLGGPIRKCYAASCDAVVQTYSGEWLHWDHYATNGSGNRWYYVRYSFGNGIPHTVYGWIYCGNVTAPC